MKTKHYYLIFLSFLFAALSSSIVAKQPFAVTPRTNLPPSIAADGWLKSGDSLSFKGIGPGNRVKIRFDDWRPEGAPNALVRVSSCDNEVGRFVVSNNKAITIPVDQSCGEARLTFRFENQISSGGRELGVKLISGEVSSPLGLAIPEVRLLLAIWLMAIITLSSLSRALNLISLSLFSAGCLLVAFEALSWESLPYFIAWALLITFVSVGWCQGANNSADSAQRQLSRFGEFVPVALLTVLALALRLWGIDFDGPATYHHDERWKVLAVLGMIQRGSFNPEYFLHPSLLLYLASAFSWILHLILGWPWDEIHIRLAGRLVSVIFGSLSVPILFQILKEGGKIRAGWLAAFLLAFNPLHLTCSRYFKEDTLLVFMLLVSVLFAGRYLRLRTRPYLILYGLFLGFAFGAKYTAAVMLFPSLLILLSVSNLKGSLKNILTVGLVALAGFLITTPYALLDLPNFLKGISYESNHMLIGDSIAISPWRTLWMYHFTRSFIPALTQPLLWCSLAGVGMLFKRRQQISWLAFISLFFYIAAEAVSAKVEPQVERYILPCIPFMLACAAIFIEEITQSGWLTRAGAFVLIVLVLMRTGLLLLNIGPDTRVLFAEKVKRELPPGTVVMADHPFNTPFFSAGTLALQYPTTRPLINAYTKELTSENLRKLGIKYMIVSDLSFACLRYCPEAPLSAIRSVERLAKEFEIVDSIENRSGAYGFHNPSLFLLRLKHAPAGAELYARQRAILLERAQKLFSKIYQLW